MAGPKPEDLYNPVAQVEPTIGMPDDYRRVEATPNTFGAQVGQAQEKFGATAQQVSDQTMETALKYQNYDNQMTALAASKDYAKFVSDAEMGFRQNQGVNAGKALPDFQKSLSDTYEQMAAQIQSPLARQIFMQDARNFYDRTLYSAGIYVGDETKKGVITAQEGRIQSVIDFTALHFDDPVQLSKGLHDIVTSTNLIAEQRGIKDPDAVHSLMTQNAGKLAQSVILATASQGVTLKDQLASYKAANKLFGDLQKQSVPESPGVPMMDAKIQVDIARELNNKELSLQYRVDRQEEVYAGHQRVAITNQMENAMAMLGKGVKIPDNYLPTAAQISSAYPKNPEMAQIQVERLQDLQDTNRFMGLLPGMTPQQVFNLKEMVKPDPSRPQTFARQARLEAALDRTLSVRAQAIKSDSAGYIASNNPEIGSLLEASKKDPSVFPHYVQAVQTQQEVMQVPLNMRHVLPAGEAQSLAEDIQKDPSSVAKYQQAYGPYWNSVFKDAVQLGKLPATYQSIAVLPPGDGQLLAKVISDRQNEKGVEKLLDAKTNNAIKSAVEGGMTTLVDTLKAQGMDPAQARDIVNSATDLAYGYNYYKNQQPPAAVQSAVNAFKGMYDFSLGTARIPKDKAATVLANTRYTLETLDENKIRIPDTIGKTPGGPTTPDYIAWLKANPTWITAPGGNAVRLKDPAGKLVLTPEGRPLEIPFNSPLMRAMKDDYQTMGSSELRPFGAVQ